MTSLNFLAEAVGVGPTNIRVKAERVQPLHHAPILSMQFV